MDDVVLDLEVVADKISSVRVVGHNPTDPGRGQKDVGGFMGLEEVSNTLLVREIELEPLHRVILWRAAVVVGDEVGVAALLEGADNGAAHHARPTGYEYFVLFLHNIFKMFLPQRRCDFSVLKKRVSLTLMKWKKFHGASRIYRIPVTQSSNHQSFLACTLHPPRAWQFDLSTTTG